jgi:hypothetical protein
MPDEITRPNQDYPESLVIAEKPAIEKIKDAASHRLQSIDALRGFDMFMITGGTDFIVTLFALFAQEKKAPPIPLFYSIKMIGS